MDSEIVRLGPFQLDRQNYSLRQGSEETHLTPKVFAVLDQLAKHRGETVTKQELLDTVWRDEPVGDAVLKTVIREIRRHLGDSPKSPKFIQTIHRRGYRLLPNDAPEDVAGETSATPAARPTVGRNAVLQKLDRHFDQTAQQGPQIVLVTGEAGIGKSTVIDLFAANATANEATVIRGQCIEHYGAGEAYLPILDAIGRLIQSADGQRATRKLRRFAPTWVSQLPALADEADVEALRRDVLGATHERMLREMVEALEALAADSPLVLVIEDLQWSDYSTLDLLSWLARRRSSARLLVLGSYRPVEVVVRDHPLRAVLAELRARERYHELQIGFFGVDEVREFLGLRLPHATYPSDLPEVLHQRTGGNPLFLVHVVEELLSPILESRDAQDAADLQLDPDMIKKGVPESIRALLEKRLARLGATSLELLEVAAVCGLDLDLRVIAGAADVEPATAEKLCDELVLSHGILLDHQPLADASGELIPCYRFQHSLIRSVVVDRLTPVRRARLHQRVGKILEQLHEGHTGELAAELALHFAECQNAERTVHYRMRAAQNASTRHAHREALDHLADAAQQAKLLYSAQRTQALLAALETRGLVLRSMGDMQGSAEEFEVLAATAREHGIADREIRALVYQASSLFWVSRERCLQVMDNAVVASQRLQDPLLEAHVRGSRGHWNLNLRGWTAADARDCRAAVEAAESAEDSALLRQHSVRLMYVELLCGDYRAADEMSAQAIELAFEQGDVYDYLLAHFFRSWALLHSGEWGTLLTVLDHAQEVAGKNGHELWTQLLELIRAQLYFEAQDFEGALRLVRPIVEHAHRTSEPIGQLFFHGSIVAGLAELGAGNPAGAIEYLEQVEESVRTEGHEVDCLLHLPLWWGLAECRALQEDWSGVDASLATLLSITEQSGEPTYQTLGSSLQNWARYRAASNSSSIQPEDNRVPTATLAPAAWKSCLRAAELFEAVGERSAAEEHRRRAGNALTQLAQSLRGSTLRESFVASPPFQEFT